MKKLLIVFIAIQGIFYANLFAQTATRPDGLNSWHQSPEQNVSAQFPTIIKAFDGSKTSGGSIKLDSIIALKSQLQYFTYDSLGHWLSDIEYSGWDSDKNLYTAGYEHFNTYANGFLSTQILKNYDYINKLWFFSYKADFKNDLQGRPTLYTLYYWNEIKSTWDAQSKYVSTYNLNGKKILETDSVWNQTTLKFDNSNKYEFQYDANGNQIIKTRYNWRTDQLVWSIYTKNENTYDANGNITLSKNYLFNNTGLSYLTDQSEYTYDAGNLITMTTYTGSFGSTTLTKSTKEEYTYDSNGNRTQESDYNWNSAKQEWTNAWKYDYSYDLSVNVSDILWPFAADNWKHNKLTSSQNTQWTSNQWKAYPAYQYYYSDYHGIIPLEIVQTGASNINLNAFPNPFTTTTTIRFKVIKPGIVSLKIFDAMGSEIASLVNEKKPVGDYLIDWNTTGIKGGIYFCRLQSGISLETKKLIKQR